MSSLGNSKLKDQETTIILLRLLSLSLSLSLCRKPPTLCFCMAPKHPSNAMNNPQSSSEEDEEPSSSEYETASESDSETESESDSGSVGETGVANAKPIASKHVEKVTPPPKATKPSASQAKPGTKRLGGESELIKDSKKAKKKKGNDEEDLKKAKKKKGNDEEDLKKAKKRKGNDEEDLKKAKERKGNDEEDLKKAKKKKGNDEEDLKKAKKKGIDKEDDGVEEELEKPKQLFQRVWSEEDEIILLKGMNEYTMEKRLDPSADVNAFLNFIKGKLKLNVSKSQLQDKIRRMKKKFENIVNNKYKPTNPHEWAAFELSKNVWGDGEDLAGKVEQLKSSGNAQNMLRDVLGFDNGFKELRLSETIVNQGLQWIGESNCAELLKDRWNKLHVAELEHFVMKTELMRDLAKLILEALKSSNH
ncbi:probable transcription factor At2g01370 [Rosa chinensis]|uniref:probable transcription factor At2g01370 n=1 Tax=Rosa chinensis TaxID=74649 RepID=UPI000D08DD08|nr:probable transcription factor At2g01370 [Rosa chinensis]